LQAGASQHDQQAADVASPSKRVKEELEDEHISQVAGQWPILHGFALLGIALFLHKVWCSKYSSQYLA